MNFSQRQIYEIGKPQTLIEELAGFRPILLSLQNGDSDLTEEECYGLMKLQCAVERRIAVTEPTCHNDLIIQLEVANECLSSHLDYKLDEELDLEGDCHATDVQLVRTALAYVKSLKYILIRHVKPLRNTNRQK